MDIEKLVEDGARAICRSGKFESGQGTCSLLCMESLGDVRKSGCSHSTKLHGTLARAVLALALKAAAEEADDRAQTYADLANRHDGTQMRASYTDRCGACASVAGRLRALAAQLGGSDDARCR